MDRARVEHDRTKPVVRQEQVYSMRRQTVDVSDSTGEDSEGDATGRRILQEARESRSKSRDRSHSSCLHRLKSTEIGCDFTAVITSSILFSAQTSTCADKPLSELEELLYCFIDIHRLDPRVFVIVAARDVVYT